MAIGHDTIIVEEVCARIGAKIDVVIAPAFEYGPTGYALGGPEDGTIDPDYNAFFAHVKAILDNFVQMGFKRVFVIIMHQGMGGPLALACSKAAAELSFERALARHGRGWWADGERSRQIDWGQVQVQPDDIARVLAAGGGRSRRLQRNLLPVGHPPRVGRARQAGR